MKKTLLLRDTVLNVSLAVDLTLANGDGGMGAADIKQANKLTRKR